MLYSSTKSRFQHELGLNMSLKQELMLWRKDAHDALESVVRELGGA